MADRSNQLKSAEELLKQGKVQPALHQLDRLAEGASNDLLTLNRIGDILARQKLAKEAIRYYTRIAAQFIDQGFYSKAVAIHKKILRLEPQNPASLLKLGELYLHQKLPGEATEHLLAAAERYIQAQELDQARQIYERLVEAQPQDLRHRARLAEARALEGDNEGAATELVDLGRRLLENEQHEDAERTFRRAAELSPKGVAPRLGIADCLSATGREEDALAYLEEQGAGGEPLIVGEIALRYARSEREDEALKRIRGLEASTVPFEILKKWFGLCIESGSADALWEKMTPVFETWAEADLTRTSLGLSELARLEEGGHIPALQRSFELLKQHDQRAGMTQALERLLQAYESRSMDEKAAATREQLKSIAPKSAALGASASAPVEAPTTDPVPVPDAGAADDPAEFEAEAPAVPLNKNDEEFVTGRLTQAEILEKYGLRGQALEQVREVTKKFPGDVGAQQRLVELLREGADRAGFRDALTSLALAHRASGEMAQAREAAGEAFRLGGLSSETRELLERMSLIATSSEAAAPVASPEEAPATPEAESAEAAASSPTLSAPRPRAAAGREVLVIDLEDMGEEDAEEVEEAEVAAEGEPEAAAVDAPAVEDAAAMARPVSENEAQQALEALPGEPVEAPEVREEPQASAALDVDDVFDDDDDLSAITSALEGELFADDEEQAAPSATGGGEQSLSDVFAAFKQHVEEQVEGDDFRTHYDLGIAYKEMDLSEEAIHEFEIAVKSPEFEREASIMLGICHRERKERAQAVQWYRKALEIPSSDGETSGVRYDLADLLLENGEREEALALFRGVLENDPSFRDIRERVAELEAPPVSE